MDLTAEITKWRKAHENLFVPEEALATMAPFASLYATDFAVFLESRGGDPQVVSFVRAISRELAWAYDNWTKVQHDADAPRLIDAMLNEVRLDGAHNGA